jgi:CheY-like chemotaxis protein/two-component sensor histidine kinase
MAAANLPDPGVQWARDVIARQVTHLGRLVDDLLDMSRITTGNITLHTERLDLSEVVSRAVDSSRPLVEEQGHTLSLTLPQEPLHVEGDPTRLSQVVMNLVNNAAKYTPKGGRIWVTVRSEPGQAVLSVRDSGIGMAPDFIPRIFDLFVQAERTLDRSQGGLGVGLALVRQLAARHGGTVAAFSPGPGQGSEFVVRLPALAPPGAAAPASATDAGVAQGPKTHRVLVVDDNPDSVESMSMLLQMWGHDVQVASNGTAALDLAAEHLPEVVLLDIGLPGLSGYEVAERLRAIPGLADAVLVAMTGYGQKEDFRRSEEAGFTLHLVKPLNPDALRRVFADLDARGTKPASV